MRIAEMPANVMGEVSMIKGGKRKNKSIAVTKIIVSILLLALLATQLAGFWYEYQWSYD